MELEMKHRWSYGALAAALSGLMVSGSALADAQANLTVNANVQNSCQINAATLDFGNLNPLANTDAQTDIQWRCTNGFGTQIQLNGGAAGDINARRMSGSLGYQLYRDASRTLVWGDTVATQQAVTGTGYGAVFNTIPVYGRVTAAAAAAANGGAYTDTVVMTIIF
jgi:spore coat protein U-like protein